MTATVVGLDDHADGRLIVAQGAREDVGSIHGGLLQAGTAFLEASSICPHV
jgi:hypothetical protein